MGAAGVGAVGGAEFPLEMMGGQGGVTSLLAPARPPAVTGAPLSPQLGPNVSIGKGVTVGAGVRLRESIILHGASLQVGAGPLVKVGTRARSLGGAGRSRTPGAVQHSQGPWVPHTWLELGSVPASPAGAPHF